MIAVLVAAVSLGQTTALETKWSRQVTPENVHREYPRPQMVRRDWQNLNGTWDIDLRGTRHQILVPFPVESRLSTVGLRVNPEDTIHYSRTFSAPQGERVLLHFGACDWRTRVEVNGQEVGQHEGGFDPFSFEITAALKPTGEQRLDVYVTDPTSAGPQPRGKQHLSPQHILYTPSSGIWQTAWLEPLPDTYIEKLDVATDVAARTLSVSAKINGSRSARVRLSCEGKSAVGVGSAKISFDSLDLWSPDHPRLYDFKVELLGTDGQVLDSVESYTAFRTVELRIGDDGFRRFFLNGQETFLMGTLDQGFWPDGLLTPPTDEALKYDIEVQKRLGFNFIRKHVKVEPDRWYMWCDRLGMLVMQDMPSGDAGIGPNDPDLERTPESAAIWRKEYTAMVESLRNHPSIFSWVVFNEGWGQFDTAANTALARKLDPTRLINAVTGWSDRGVGDFYDIHVYPGPGVPRRIGDRALFLGEFGGLGLVVPGHTWRADGWGYQSYETKDQLTAAFASSMDQLNLMRADGLMGAVYTQTTDVETELNGLLTYDRAELKMDETVVRKAVQALYEKAPKVRVLVPTSESAGQEWIYTTVDPGSGWVMVDAWPSEQRGPGGFGTPGTPGSVVRTKWDTSDIWLRRTFRLESAVTKTYLRIHHDEDAEVYLDGVLVTKLARYQTGYSLVPIGAVSSGDHELRIHCHQTQGGQYIDAGLIGAE